MREVKSQKSREPYLGCGVPGEDGGDEGDRGRLERTRTGDLDTVYGPVSCNLDGKRDGRLGLQLARRGTRRGGEG